MTVILFFFRQMPVIIPVVFFTLSQNALPNWKASIVTYVNFLPNYIAKSDKQMVRKIAAKLINSLLLDL